MRRILFILAIFLLGFGTNQLVSFLSPGIIPKTIKPMEITKEATSTAILEQMSEFESAIVKRVVDGDTIELTDGRKLRYIGIDTPETVDPRQAVGCFGREASGENRRLVDGKTVRLEKDISDTDRYGRLLRYVYIDGQMVNDVLVRNGFAYSSSYPPDVKYQEQFILAQREAQEDKRGLWGACADNTTNRPGVPSPEQSPQVNPSCVIKGNISSKEERIYHMPGCGSYDKTVIDESMGERWFCTEEEALKAGWRKAKNC